MKPDGVTMETTEPREVAAIAGPSNPQDDSTEQTLSLPSNGDAAPKTAANVNGKSTGAKPKTTTSTSTKKQPTSKSDQASATNTRPGMPSRRLVNDARPTNNVAPRTAPVKKQPALSAKPPGAGAVLKKTAGVPSAAKTQAKMPDKKPAGAASMAATVTNGTKPVNGTPKKTVPAARPKTTVPFSRPTGSTAPKTGTSTSTKPDGAAQTKATRPVTAPTSRPAAKPTTAASTTKPSTTSKPAFSSRAATAPSSGRTIAAQPNKAPAPAKKDVTRPMPAAATKKPAPATASAATKKTDVTKPAANVKPSMTSATTKADAKLPPLKPQQTIKPNATKKPAVAAARFPAVNRTAVSQTPPGSPAGRSSVNRSPAPTNTPRSKLLHKPTQAVSPLTAVKRTDKTGATKATVAAASSSPAVTSGSEVTEAAIALVQETQMEATADLPQGSTPDTKSPVVESGTILAQSTLIETVQQEMVQLETVACTASLPPQSPVRSLPQTEQQQQSEPLTTHEAAPASVSPVAFPPQPSANNVDLITDPMSSTSKLQSSEENVISQVVPPISLNEEEDEEEEEEEEKEGSQLVSVSDMSGTTQPTEESRPGSAGPFGASAWRVGGALLSEMDSEEVSVSQQGASELSAPGVLEGTESMDDLGDGSLKGAMDMEGASAGSPDFERVPEIPVNDYDEEEDEEEDDDDRVCDMDVGSERTDEPQRLRHDNDVDDEEDEDVEMASEGVTESGLESYGNADEDDFAEDERLDNLNRVAQLPPPPPLLPSAPGAQWDQPNPFADPWAEPTMEQHPPKPDSELEQGAEAESSPLEDPYQDSETPTQAPAQAWMEHGSAAFNENTEVPQHSFGINVQQSQVQEQTYMEQPSPAPEQTLSVTPPCAPVSSIVSSETGTPEDFNNSPSEKGVPEPPAQPELEAEAVAAADEALVCANAPGSNPSSSSVTEDEASDTEGEAQLEDSLEPQSAPDLSNVTFEIQSISQRCLSTVEEGEELEELESGAAEDATPPSATSQVSYGFDTMTTASNSNAQSTGESCVKSPGIFSLEELPEEAKEPGFTNLPPLQPCLSEQPYIECVKQEGESAEEMANSNKGFAPSPEPQLAEQIQPLDDVQPPYYSAICEKTENSFAGFTSLLHPQRRDHSSYPRSYCDIVKPVNAALASPKLSCADLPPRSPGQQSLSPQLRRLEQHQRHLQELQQRREQQSRPLEEAEQERKRREEEEQRKKKDEAEEEIKRNKEETKRREEEELKQRKDLELQLHQQQEELKQRQQIMQWQQELEQSNKGQTVLLSPSSGLCTIYEALENDDENEEAKCEDETINELNSSREMNQEPSREVDSGCGMVTPEKGTRTTHSHTQCPTSPPDHQERESSPTQNGDSSSSSPCPPESPERPPPLDLDWGKKVDIVHQLINQTLLLNGDGCSSLLLLPGGAGGTLSPLESSLWPSLLPPLTPPSATVTSVSSFSPETTGSSPQGEWTVVELETHH